MFKFNEDKTLKEALDHIASTYSSHYVGTNKADGVQVNDLLVATGRAEDFYIGNIIKYAARYGRKNQKNKRDLFKAIHYLCLLADLNEPDPEQYGDGEENSRELLTPNQYLVKDGL